MKKLLNANCFFINFTEWKVISHSSCTHPIPTDSFSWESSPSPDATMIAESGTAPKIGSTTPPVNYGI